MRFASENAARTSPTRQTIRTACGAAVSVRRTKRAPRQRLTRRSKVFQLCLTRVLRERNLAVRGEDTRMFGLSCAGMRQPAGGGGLGGGFRLVQRRTMSHTDPGIVGATT